MTDSVPVFALDVETIGVNPMTCELREVALVPLDAEFNPVGSPLNVTIRRDDLTIPAPDADDKFDREFGIPHDEGFSLGVAMELVERFLPPRFSFLGRNVGAFDSIVLRRHLKPDTWKRADYHFRDSAALQLAMQDLGMLPAGRLSLRTLAEALGVEWKGQRHRALPDALMEAEVYRAMLARIRGAVKIERDVCAGMLDAYRCRHFEVSECGCEAVVEGFADKIRART